MLPDELRLYRLLQVGLSRAEIEDGSAIEHDWLLAIHQTYLKVQNEPPAQRAGHDGTVTRPLGPPGG